MYGGVLFGIDFGYDVGHDWSEWYRHPRDGDFKDENVRSLRKITQKLLFGQIKFPPPANFFPSRALYKFVEKQGKHITAPLAEFRRVTALPTLMHWRAEVIAAVFGQEPSARLLVANRSYFRQHTADGSLYACIASVDGTDCACGAICFGAELPSPDNPSGLTAYFMNIYVRPQFRGRGIARALMAHLIAEARDRGCTKLWLESTPQAYHLYLRLGFRPFHDILHLPT